MLKIPLDFIVKSFPELTNVQELKTGGQKIVFSANHAAWGDVAVKLIPPEHVNERIFREIKTGKVHCFCNVPRIYDSNKVIIFKNEFLFIIEQFIEGKDLRSLKMLNYQFSFQEVVDLLEALLQTLVELEKAHIVHRDIKLDNIIYEKKQTFWLIDFGIARELDLVSLTATSQNFGPHSLGYASPEQLRNQKNMIDSRSDLFSLGVVAYELLSGENPFIVGASGIIDIIQKTEIFQVPSLCVPEDTNGELSTFLHTLMQKSPLWRPPTAEAAYKWFKEIRPKEGNS